MDRIRLTFLLLMLPMAGLSGLTIETAYTRYYKEGEIRPIRQYFGASLTGQGFRTVVPSQLDEPAGQYFIARIKGDKVPGAVTARMTLYATDSKDPSTRSWDLTGKKLEKWLYLGLTGNDWPNEDVQPLAWHIELLGTDGGILAEWKSFLWELP